VPVTSYAIALGSNRPGHHGPPSREIAAAIAILRPIAASPVFHTPALGPSKRRFANAAVLIETRERPDELLARLKAIERDFGRRRGIRWGARVLDLDIILWSEGAWSDAALTIPHPSFRERNFVLQPLVRIAPLWRDPLTHRTVRQLLARISACPNRSPSPRRHSS
jgi:2-amino-4-hydroxy-6-hydroxymethyldihydropteridine diphosphokinase